VKQIIWTEAAHNFLYEGLVREFGQFHTWGGYIPNNHAHYKSFLEAVCVAVGCSSAEAVSHQIRFACPISGPVLAQGGHRRNYILNLAAALRAGFIRDQDLPDMTLVSPTKNKDYGVRSASTTTTTIYSEEERA
jgi:hypothetical protein